MSTFSVAIGSDHVGFHLKQPLAALLKGKGYIVEDCGSYDSEPVDFPDVTAIVCARVREGRAERGILVCGTGVGACIAANKIPGIRASVCHDIYSAHQCVEHDNVNVVCLGADIVGERLAGEYLLAFLSAAFSTAEEFRRRVAKLDELERSAARD